MIKKTNIILFNPKKWLTALLRRLNYASYNLLASYTRSSVSGRLLGTPQHIAGHAQSSPLIGQAQVFLQTTGVVSCWLSSRSTLGQETESFWTLEEKRCHLLDPHGTLGSVRRLPACDPTATFKCRRLLDMCSTMYLAPFTCPFWGHKLRRSMTMNPFLSWIRCSGRDDPPVRLLRSSVGYRRPFWSSSSTESALRNVL